MNRNIISIVLIIGAFGLFFLYSKPTYSGSTGSSIFEDQSIKELRAKKIEFDDAFLKFEEIRQIRGALLEKFNSISKEEKEKLVRALPSHIDNVRLIIDVSTAAQKYGMNIGEISLSEASGSGETTTLPDGSTVSVNNRGPYSSVKLGFSFTATYENALSFLEDLQNSLRIIDIIKLNISGGEKDKYQFELEINTYKLNS